MEKDEAWLTASGSARVRKSLEVRDSKNLSSFCSRYWDVALGVVAGCSHRPLGENREGRLLSHRGQPAGSGHHHLVAEYTCPFSRG